MKQLLRFEFRKLFRSKAFYVCFAISVAFILITALTMKALEPELKKLDENYQSVCSGLTMLKDVFSNGQIAILGGIMISILVCEDFTSDTLKNVYARGYTRQQVFYAKVVSTLSAYFSVIFADMLLSVLFGTFMFDGFGTAGSNYVGAFFGTLFLALAYFAIFFTISYLCRKLALAITLCIVGPIGMSLILALGDNLVSKLGDFKFSDYWLDGRLKQMAQIDVGGGQIAGAIIISVIVIAGFACLVSLVNRHRDA